MAMTEMALFSVATVLVKTVSLPPTVVDVQLHVILCGKQKRRDPDGIAPKVPNPTSSPPHYLRRNVLMEPFPKICFVSAQNVNV